MQLWLLDRPARGPGAACKWCHGEIPAGVRRDAETCSKLCRQAHWRFDQGPGDLVDATDRPRAFAYADPPYPGKAGYYDERQEVDHASLLDRLMAGWPDGWALSTSAAALRDVLPLCPPATRVCAWRRRTRPTRSRRALSAWEPLLVHGGRELRTDRVQDLEDALDYRGRYNALPGRLIGMKPPQFAVWMFRQLGAQPGDTLADLYPGSGAIGRAWARYAGTTVAGDG